MLCLSSLLLPFFLLSRCFCHENEKLMVCKPANSVFETRQINSTNQGCSSSAGRPGKQGARGLRGPPGPAGAPGLVDHEQLNLSLRTELEQFKKKLQCIDGVVVENTCYKLIYRVGVSVNYARAKSLCAYHGGGLAEIPTEMVYNALYNYVRTNWYIHLDRHDAALIHCWLGSSYDGQGNVILTSGQRSYVRWYPGNPISDARATHMSVRFPIRPEDATQGMFNIWPEHVNLHVPLCQFQLE